MVVHNLHSDEANFWLLPELRWSPCGNMTNLTVFSYGTVEKIKYHLTSISTVHKKIILAYVICLVFSTSHLHTIAFDILGLGTFLTNDHV